MPSDAGQTSRPSSQSFFQMVEGEAPSAMALQSRAPAGLPCTSNGEFIPQFEQLGLSSGLVSAGELHVRSGVQGQ